MSSTALLPSLLHGAFAAYLDATLPPQLHTRIEEAVFNDVVRWTATDAEPWSPRRGALTSMLADAVRPGVRAEVITDAIADWVRTRTADAMLHSPRPSLIPAGQMHPAASAAAASSSSTSSLHSGSAAFRLTQPPRVEYSGRKRPGSHNEEGEQQHTSRESDLSAAAAAGAKRAREESAGALLGDPLLHSPDKLGDACHSFAQYGNCIQGQRCPFTHDSASGSQQLSSSAQASASYQLPLLHSPQPPAPRSSTQAYVEPSRLSFPTPLSPLPLNALQLQQNQQQQTQQQQQQQQQLQHHQLQHHQHLQQHMHQQFNLHSNATMPPSLPPPLPTIPTGQQPWGGFHPAGAPQLHLPGGLHASMAHAAATVPMQVPDVVLQAVQVMDALNRLRAQSAVTATPPAPAAAPLPQPNTAELPFHPLPDLRPLAPHQLTQLELSYMKRLMTVREEKMRRSACIGEGCRLRCEAARADGSERAPYPRERATVALPCKHRVLCEPCMINATECPLCHTAVESYIVINLTDGQPATGSAHASAGQTTARSSKPKAGSQQAAGAGPAVASKALREQATSGVTVAATSHGSSHGMPSSAAAAATVTKADVMPPPPNGMSRKQAQPQQRVRSQPSVGAKKTLSGAITGSIRPPLSQREHSPARGGGGGGGGAAGGPQLVKVVHRPSVHIQPFSITQPFVLPNNDTNLPGTAAFDPHLPEVASSAPAQGGAAVAADAAQRPAGGAISSSVASTSDNPPVGVSVPSPEPPVKSLHAPPAPLKKLGLLKPTNLLSQFDAAAQSSHPNTGRSGFITLRPPAQAAEASPSTSPTSTAAAAVTVTHPPQITAPSAAAPDAPARGSPGTDSTESGVAQATSAHVGANDVSGADDAVTASSAAPGTSQVPTAPGSSSSANSPTVWQVFLKRNSTASPVSLMPPPAASTPAVCSFAAFTPTVTAAPPARAPTPTGALASPQPSTSSPLADAAAADNDSYPHAAPALIFQQPGDPSAP